MRKCSERAEDFRFCQTRTLLNAVGVSQRYDKRLSLNDCCWRKAVIRSDLTEIRQDWVVTLLRRNEMPGSGGRPTRAWKAREGFRYGSARQTSAMLHP